jgi:hypothetical protein
MSGPDNAADDELIARLSRVAAQADPVPAALVVAARGAFGLRELDARVAELVRDSAAGATASLVRGPGTRLLSFEADEGAVECEVTVRDTRRDLVGQFVGAMPAAVRVTTPGTAATAPVDDQGRFCARDIPAGLLRLRWSLADGTTLVTSWVSV